VNALRFEKEPNVPDAVGGVKKIGYIRSENFYLGSVSESDKRNEAISPNLLLIDWSAQRSAGFDYNRLSPGRLLLPVPVTK